MPAREPDFRLSLLDAAADYLEEDMPDAAARSLKIVLDRSGDGRVAEWLDRIEVGDEALQVARELRAEVATLRAAGLSGQA